MQQKPQGEPTLSQALLFSFIMPDGGAVVKENGRGWEGFWGERGPRQAARASSTCKQIHTGQYMVRTETTENGISTTQQTRQRIPRSKQPLRSPGDLPSWSCARALLLRSIRIPAHKYTSRGPNVNVRRYHTGGEDTKEITSDLHIILGHIASIKNWYKHTRRQRIPPTTEPGK